MSERDFSTFEVSDLWLAGQSDDLRFRACSRLALRVLPSVSLEQGLVFDHVALCCFRAILLSAIRGQKLHIGLDWLEIASEAYTAISVAKRNVTFAQSDDAAATAGSSLIAVHSLSGTAAGAQTSAYTASSDTLAESAGRAVLLSPNSELTSFSEPLWGAVEIPPALRKSYGKLIERMAASRETWFYWHDWYLGMWEGTFRDWDLALEVAKIPNEVWNEGAEAVAARIREIQHKIDKALPRPENVPELEREKLLLHVRRLLTAPEMTGLAAEGAAATLRQAIKQYLDTAPANCLPDQLAHLDGLPPLFDGISQIVKSSDHREAKEKRLADQIEALNAQVAQLEAELRVARSKTVHGLFKESMIKAMGASFGAGVIGSVGLGAAHFFGAWPDDFTLENLRGFLSDVETATPKASEPNMLPPATDT